MTLDVRIAILKDGDVKVAKLPSLDSLGMQGQDITPDLARSFKFRQRRGGVGV